jgi:hypothetical protein
MMGTALRRRKSLRVVTGWMLFLASTPVQSMVKHPKPNHWHAPSAHASLNTLKNLPPLSAEDLGGRGFPDSFSLKDQYEKKMENGVCVEASTTRVIERWTFIQPEHPSHVEPEGFQLFLALQSIGYPLAREQVETLYAYNPFMEKERGRAYSRRVFKHIARKRGMPDSTVKPLSRLLHADIIDGYLTLTQDGETHIHSFEAACNLLARDGTKSGLGVGKFWDLCVLFHQCTADEPGVFEEGSLTYKPDLKRRVQDVSDFLKKVENFQEISTNELVKLEALPLEAKSTKEVGLTCEQLYDLAFYKRVILYYSKNKEDMDALELFTKRFLPAIEEYLPDWRFQQIKKSLESALPLALHGTGSPALIGLHATDFYMMPFCYMLQYGITYLSGETAKDGLGGVNNHAVSLAPQEAGYVALEYALESCASADPSANIQNYMILKKPDYQSLELFVSSEKVRSIQKLMHYIREPAA